MFTPGNRLLSALGATAIAIGTCCSYAQTPASALKFEVASIRPNPDHGINMPDGKRFHVTSRGHPVTPPASLSGISGNRFTEQAATLSDLIMDAYRLREFQIAGGPRWVRFDGDAFDIQAKAEGDGQPTSEQVRLMLQTLLATRFRLKFHFEKRDAPVYQLVIAKSGSKMKQAAFGPDGKPPKGATYMVVLDNMVAQFLDRPLVDKTGLEGYFLTKWDQSELISEKRQTGGTQAAPSVFRTVQEQLGLELKATKSPFDTLVIDSVDKPSEN
jgi:uncharacterized protein (TIGR03435 family)